jgi:hypothetical protein
MARVAIYFQTKNPTKGKFSRLLQWTLLAYFMVMWSFLRPFGIFFPILVCCAKKNLATLLMATVTKNCKEKSSQIVAQPAFYQI